MEQTMLRLISPVEANPPTPIPPDSDGPKTGYVQTVPPEPKPKAEQKP